jgi:hypothetical protein
VNLELERHDEIGGDVFLHHNEVIQSSRISAAEKLKIQESKNTSLSRSVSTVPQDSMYPTISSSMLKSDDKARSTMSDEGLFTPSLSNLVSIRT